MIGQPTHRTRLQVEKKEIVGLPAAVALLRPEVTGPWRLDDLPPVWRVLARSCLPLSQA
jgi:hypothetical protein